MFVQVETLKKEIEEQERSYKSRLAVQEKRAHDSWVASRQLERRLEEAKQEAAQLRNRLIQVEKEKEAMLNTKENGMASNGGSEELLKNCSKREFNDPSIVGSVHLLLKVHSRRSCLLAVFFVNSSAVELFAYLLRSLHQALSVASVSTNLAQSVPCARESPLF